MKDHLDQQVSTFSKVCFGHVVENITIVIDHGPVKNICIVFSGKYLSFLTGRTKTRDDFQGQIYRCREWPVGIRTEYENYLLFPSDRSRG